MWAEYIESANQLYNSIFSISKNFISPQSFKIFTSLAESLILLIISHHEFYSLYPLYLWEHSTEAIEHLFGISCQITNDFSFYEFFKIQQRVTYRNKIIRQGIQIQKEKTSASGYVFDFNPNSMSNENIDILRIWSDDNAIYDAIKTAYNDAARFIKTLGIKLLNDKTIPHFYISISHQSMAISDLLKNSDDDFDIDNVSGLDFNDDEFKLDNLNKNSFTGAASEVAQLSQLVNLTELELKQISDISDSSKVELDYILSTNKLSSLIEFQQNELFYTNAPNISRANVTDNNPLRENRFILFISKGSIFLGKILSLYRSISMRYAYVSFSQDIDSLSYISVATFANTDGNLFSQICKSDGNIFAHIIPKQVIYYFDNSCLDVNNVANLPSHLCMEGNS
ncbi:hypothetical protein GLOIN_2v1822254 [Rhizophagus clarus]|nr:hypothetical protein GLOIN_2v1822254 [Rhizophagus clarus]